MEQLLAGTNHEVCLKKLEAYLQGVDEASKAKALEALIKYALENALPTQTIKTLISFCALHAEICVNCVGPVSLQGDEEAFSFLCEKFQEDNFFYYEMFDTVVNYPLRLKIVIKWLKKAQFDILDVLEKYFGFYEAHLCRELPKEAEPTVHALYKELRKDGRHLPKPEDKFGLLKTWLLSLREDV